MAVETLLIGLVLALLWAETTDVSPGGIIVPGYLALYLGQPLSEARALVPDLEGTLPGRGLWLSAERALAEKAFARGLFAKAARRAVT